MHSDQIPKITKKRHQRSRKSQEYVSAINSVFFPSLKSQESVPIHPKPEEGLPEGRVAEVAREHRWHPPKSLDSDENFKPEHTLFCRELRFVAIYALFFGDLWI